MNSCNYLPIYLGSWLEEANVECACCSLGLVDVARIGRIRPLANSRA